MPDPSQRPAADVLPSPNGGVDPTIRNQRYHGWPAWAGILGWFAAWLPAAWLVEWLTPREWVMPVLVAVGLPIVATFILLVRHLDRRPVERIRLGDELRAYPSGRFQPADLVSIEFSPDPDEDYVEDKLPVPWCQVAVRGRLGRTIRLVASAADAARLREWAGRNGVAVIDPGGLVTGGGRNNRS